MTIPDDILMAFADGELDDAITLASGPNTRAGTNRVLFRVYGEF